jgi:hypothetical protein
VNKKYRMTAHRKNLATFTIIIGVLTLILAASALAEKAHEGHLPERNGRGAAETIVSSGIPAWIIILLSAVSGSVSKANDHRENTRSGQSRCQAGTYHLPLQWQMRWPYFAIPVQKMTGY